MTIESPRLAFRAHEWRDLEAYCAIESDPVYRHPQRVHDRAELERSFREEWMVPKPMGLLATVLKETDTYIGRCGLYPLPDDAGRIIAGEACLAFYLGRAWWNRGLATEAAQAFVRHGFESLGLRRIVAGVNAANAASRRVLEKSGFVLVRSGAGGGSQWHDFEVRKPEGAVAP